MMAQESIDETLESSVVLNDHTNDGSSVDSASLDPSISRNTSFSRLNAQAPEFVPRSSNRSDLQQPRLLISQGPRPIPTFQAPNSPFHVQVQNHGHYQNYGSFGDHEIVQTQAAFDPDPDPVPVPVPVTKNGLSEEAAQKILNQVEYYFSDINLATTDHLMRFINKDPEGFVPISVVAAFRKIKFLISGHPQLAIVLRSSSKLVVSDDGKKVRRQQPLTESDMEDLQSRIVVAENLPEDHSYQNLMKVFSAIGGVKTIRTCQPQSSSVGASAASRSVKMDMFFSNKLHAFVEYETVELAEQAVSELNDERNWRSGLRVRILLKHSPKSEQTRDRKSTREGEGNSEENGVSTSEQPNDKVDDHSQPSDASSHDHTGDEVVHDKENMPRKAKGRGRGRGRPRGHYQNNRGSHIGTPPPKNIVQNEHSNVNKLPPGPRMPDGTRGFAMGRGKPIGI